MDRRERANDTLEAVRVALEGWQAKLWTALPGIIQSFDNTTLTCTVQPAITAKTRTQDGRIVDLTLPLLLDCPVIFPSGGGFTLTFPLQKDDTCLVIFSARCIDGWWLLGDVQPQLELRMHDLSDGFVIPGPRAQIDLPNVSKTNARLQLDSGATYIEIDPRGKVRIEAQDIELHGRGSFKWDVFGYGQRVRYNGNNTWDVETWQDPRPGDIINKTENVVNPPEGPQTREGPDGSFPSPPDSFTA